MQDLKIFDKVEWNLRQPLSKLKVKGMRECKFTSNSVQNFLKTEVDIKDEDKVVILDINYGYKAALTTYIDKPESQYRVIDVLETIERMLKTPIKPGIRYIKPCTINYFEDDIDGDKFIYKKIEEFFGANTRIKLTKDYENSELTPVDLLGDHIHFEEFQGQENYLFMILGS